MRLYFFRHGDASDDAPTDAERPLTDKGRTRTANAAKILTAMNVKPAKIYTSPRVRAKQTAAILSEALGVPPHETPQLDFEFDVVHVDDLIALLNDDAEVLFVGHNPSFEEVVSALVGGGDIVMKKGSLARVDILDRETLASHLVWLIPPAAFDAGA
jgi:phosphohistidine phosphatase